MTAITAKARHSGFTTEGPRKGEDPMTKTVLYVLAVLAVTVGALTITGAVDDMSSTPTITTLPLLY